MNEKSMFSNKNIVKYSLKYFVVLTVGAYVLNTCTNLINQKSDVANLVGTALFAGLFIGSLIILRSDVTKLVKNIKSENKENE
jgi:hypothetical protein